MSDQRSPRSLGRRARALATALTLAAAAGCGELTSGGLGGVETSVSGDGSEPSGAPAASPTAGGAPDPTGGPARAPAPAPAPARATSAIEGRVTTTLRVYLQGDGGGWTLVTSGTPTVEVAVDGSDEASAGRASVSAGTYTRARVVFTDVRANVTAGLVIGGLEVTGEVRVDLGGADSLVVERAVDVRVEGDARSSLLVDLNAPVWLQATSPLTRTVAAAALAGAVEVRGR